MSEDFNYLRDGFNLAEQLAEERWVLVRQIFYLWLDHHKLGRLFLLIRGLFRGRLLGPLILTVHSIE